MENSIEVKCPETSNPNPVKAIRLKCIDCSGGHVKEVERCVAKDCPIYPFRLGKNPFRIKRELSDEEKERLKAQLARGREKQVKRK